MVEGSTIITHEGATLHLGDCIDVLKTLPKCSVDAVITDPPYMIGAASVGNTALKRGSFVDLNNTAHWYALWFAAAKRCLKTTGYICVFSNWRGIPILSKAFDLIGERVASILVWDKVLIGPGGRNQLRPVYEVVLFCAMPDATIDNRSASDIYRCRWQSRAGFRKTTHAAEKPLELMKHLIGLTTQPDAIVLDCFMGSGTTGVAAQQMGRRFIGIEADTRYFSDAVARIKANNG